MGIGERRKLSFAGHVSVNVVLDERYDFVGRSGSSLPIGLPEFDDEGEDMNDTLYDAVLGAVESIPRGKRKDLAHVQEAVRRAVRVDGERDLGQEAGRDGRS